VKISGATAAKFKILSTVLADSGIYTCRIKNLYNQEILSTPIQVAIQSYPTVTINGNSSVCPGNVVSLSANGASTYVWSTGQTSNAIAPVINGTTTITIQGTQLGCTSSASKTISNFALPNITISSSAMNVCAGAPAILSASGANTYTWSNGQTGLNTTVNPVLPTTYTALGTDLNGCSNSTNISIGILTPPVVLITSNKTSLCAGDTATLSASGANTYAWSNGQNGANIVVSPTTPNVYSVVGTDALGCTANTNFAINPLALPNVSAYSNLNNICPSTNILLFASGANTFQWNTGQFGNFVASSPQTTSNFTVVGTDANGCKNSFQLLITVKPKPQITISVNDSVICDGEQVILTASGASVYTWSTGNTGPIIFANPSQTISYSVNGLLNGCSGTGQRQIVVHPKPSVSFNLLDSSICAGNSSLLLTGGLPSGGVYSGPNVQNGVFSSAGLQPGLYTIQYLYTDILMCSNTTTDLMFVDACLGVKGLNHKTNTIRVFPNPFNEEIYIQHDFNPNLILKLYNQLGQMIWTQSITNANTKLVTSHLLNGSYYIVISDQEKMIYSQHLVKGL
jgi:hypothetical protein